MGWETSDRRSRLPADWRRLRRLILERDEHRCTWTDNGQRCRQPATDVDHVNRGDDHTPANLRSLCSHHHARKSSSEGNRARQRYTNRRPGEAYPGRP